MRKQRRTALYNVMFPVWMLIWFPSWLWLLLIPANYLIDRYVLYLSLGDIKHRGQFCRRHAWKVCLAGFAADFVGSLLLLGVYLSIDAVGSGWAHDVVFGLGFNPFSNVFSLLIAIFAVSISGLCIYALDLRIIRKTGLSEAQSKHSALMLATITAPYLFLLPTQLLYR